MKIVLVTPGILISLTISFYQYFTNGMEVKLAIKIGIGIIILILVIPLFIWQIIDARKLCRQYNDYYEEFGKEPNW